MNITKNIRYHLPYTIPSLYTMQTRPSQKFHNLESDDLNYTQRDWSRDESFWGEGFNSTNIVANFPTLLAIFSLAL